ncbi:Muramoyltetrapeptide carboxypeptidase [Fulvivirga imtechensis AK7]|uniref:Muramoyltetrapeptide carboxypeptidase n=2 Tax=Fulvivirga TaxID=396811 RepID=L8JNB5_9BACT|nr:Muramoyltetrapeptide carboxypeptidase [Fulvivirga imtechensis AK7]
MSASRRKFVQQLAAVPASLWFFAGANAPGWSRNDQFAKHVKPARLQEGDTVGLISPSGAIYESEPYEVAIEILEALGLEVKLGKHLFDRYGHLAGKDEDRAEEINQMFRDDAVKAIVCLRGGSGAARILDKLDYKAIAAHPKIFIGYSDITAFLLAIYAKTGLITFHGPVATSEWNTFSSEYFKKILFEGGPVLLENPPKGEDELVQVENRTRTIASGQALGVLAGGNLSVLAGLVGSGYLPDWKNKILFLEEVGEKIYAVDRMMSQLKLAGVFDELSGFVMGRCTRCHPGDGYGSLTLEEVIDHYIKPLGIPAYSGAMIGHIGKKFTVPIGLKAQIDADKGTIKLLEGAVI